MVMTRSASVRYYTTVTGCSCPAWMYRPRPCKHVVALRAAYELIAEQVRYNQEVKHGQMDI